MPGGQKGLSFIGEPMLFASVATAIIVVLLVVVTGRCGGDSASPREEWGNRCEEAYYAERSGELEEGQGAILDSEECQRHNAVAAMIAEAEDQRELQEAQQP